MRHRITPFITGLTVGVLLWGCHGPAPRAQQIWKTWSSLENLEPLVAEKAQQYGPENVLLVFDIDNTLLTMDGYLGGDAWFSLHWNRFGDAPGSQDAPLDSRDDLLAWQEVLFEIGTMSPPEADTPARIARWQRQGHPTICLTSRSPESRDATFRELERNGYDFEHHDVGQNFGGLIDLIDLAGHLFDETQAQAYQLEARRHEVCYEDGVFLTAGQHKGAFLAMLLHSMNAAYPCIIFVDDHERNGKKMTEAIQALFNSNRRVDDDVDLTVVHYTATRERVERFNDPAVQDQVAEKMETLMATVCELYPRHPCCSEKSAEATSIEPPEHAKESSP